MTGNQPIRTINISLPEPMRAFVEAEVASGSYSSVSEYFRELLRRAEREREQERLDALLLEGLASGEATGLAPEELQELRRNVRSQSLQALREKLAAAARELDEGQGRPLDLESELAAYRQRRERNQGR